MTTLSIVPICNCSCSQRRHKNQLVWPWALRVWSMISETKKANWMPDVPSWPDNVHPGVQASVTLEEHTARKDCVSGASSPRCKPCSMPTRTFSSWSISTKATPRSHQLRQYHITNADAVFLLKIINQPVGTRTDRKGINNTWSPPHA